MKPTTKPKLTRRRFIQLGGSTAGALVLTSCTGRQMGGMMDGGDSAEIAAIIEPTATVTLPPQPTAAPTLTSTPQPTATALSPDFAADVDITLRVTLTKWQFREGEPTTTLRYIGELNDGPADTLRPIPNSHFGPTIHVRRGQKLRVRMINELPAPTTIHWHGQHLPEEMDGHPLYEVDADQSYVYEFEVMNRAGSYWYHPHAHVQTGGQTYYGLAGFLIIHDDEEDALALPRGDADLPLAIQDRSFAPNNSLIYIDNPHDIMHGHHGNEIMVNGQLDYEHAVTTQPYRLRLLNASNSRVYKLAWDDGAPFTVIGTDGGLLAAPIERPFLLISPAERLDVWVDFAGQSVDTVHQLIAQPFTWGNEEIMPIMRFRVTGELSSRLTLPERFAPLKLHDSAEAVNVNNPTTFDFYVNHMTPTIDGLAFEMDAANDKETVQLGDLRIWEFTNDRNGMGGFPHPVHIHGLQFQVIDRTGTLAENVPGHVDEGWHDTVLVNPGERVKVLVKFEDYTGLFLYHCHNLEHEDGGMMRNYRVVAA